MKMVLLNCASSPKLKLPEKVVKVECETLVTTKNGFPKSLQENVKLKAKTERAGEKPHFKHIM